MNRNICFTIWSNLLNFNPALFAFHIQKVFKFILFNNRKTSFSIIKNKLPGNAPSKSFFKIYSSYSLTKSILSKINIYF